MPFYQEAHRARTRDGKELIQNEGRRGEGGSRGNLGRLGKRGEKQRKEVDLGREGGPIVGVKFTGLYDGAHKI